LTILVVHNKYKIRGGEDTVFENESAELEKRGHRVIRYVRNNSETESYGVIKKFKFFFSAISSRRTIREIKAILSKEKVDIAHIHNTFPLISPSIYRILRKSGVKTVQTIHNYRFLCPNGLFFRDGKICTLCAGRKYVNSLRYRCYRNSFMESVLYYLILTLNKKVFKKYIDSYIALTEFTKNIFISAGFDEKKIYVKGNGYEDNELRRKKSGGYFYCFGRISEEKGVDFLLENFSKTKTNLIVSGSGDKLEFYKNKYSSCNNIRFTGYLDAAAVGEFIATAQAVILPSIWYENFPMAIVESFRAGIPVIATDMGSIPFIINDGENGLLFEKGNAGKFMEKVSMMAVNVELRERLGDNARITFEKKMEFSVNIKILEDIYRRVGDEL
jgi:glycosyltransferase involved in cell wall biosynthesis